MLERLVRVEANESLGSTHGVLLSAVLSNKSITLTLRSAQVSFATKTLLKIASKSPYVTTLSFFQCNGEVNLR